MKCTLYHNPRCSKSRQALKLLEDNKVDFEVKEYLKEGLSLKELKSLSQKLSLPVLKFVRTKETIFKELELKTVSESQLLKAIVEHPILLERPILATVKNAKIGRPPEDILEII